MQRMPRAGSRPALTIEEMEETSEETGRGCSDRGRVSPVSSEVASISLFKKPRAERESSLQDGQRLEVGLARRLRKGKCFGYRGARVAPRVVSVGRCLRCPIPAFLTFRERCRTLSGTTHVTWRICHD